MSREGKSIKQNFCLCCGYLWFGRKPGKPLICARCKSPRWHLGKKRPGGRGRTKAMSDAEEKAKGWKKPLTED